MFDNLAEKTEAEAKSEEGTVTFLSINRYERKKNIALAIEAFRHLLENHKRQLRQHLIQRLTSEC